MRKTLVTFFNVFKNWLVSDYKILVLSLLITFISFPSYDLQYLPGIDGPLPWAFNYFADGHFKLGQPVLFPHGPLAFLLYPLPFGNNLVVTIVLTFVISFLLSVAFFKIYFLLKDENYLVPSLLSLILHVVADLQLLIIALTLSYIILFEYTAKRNYLAAGVFFCVLNLFIKTYGGVICGLILCSYWLNLTLVKRNYKTGGQLVLFFFSFYFAFWLSLYHTFSGSFNFLRGQMELSADNSEAVSFYQVNNWWCLGLSLIMLVAIPFFSKQNHTRFVFFMMLLPFFAAWKHAMSRGDVSHVAGYLNFLILFTLILLLVNDVKKIAVIVLCLTSLSFFVLNMALTSEANDFSKQKEVALFRPYNLYNLLVNYDSLIQSKRRSANEQNAVKKLPDTLLNLIKKNTVDVFPWNYSIIAANHLNWLPRPSLHSYAAYTHWLDQQNKEQITSGKSAHFVLWETDVSDGKFSGIDYRYLLNDAPETLISFFSTYSLKFKDKKYLLFEKRNTPVAIQQVHVQGPFEIKYDTWTAVPIANNNSILRVKLHIEKSLMGAFKSFFYKGESFLISYETADGKTHGHKIVPKNAKDGLWINPVIREPAGNSSEPPVTKIKITCFDKRMVKPTLSIDFEEFIFPADVNFLSSCFNKTDSLKTR